MKLPKNFNFKSFWHGLFLNLLARCVTNKKITQNYFPRLDFILKKTCVQKSPDLEKSPFFSFSFSMARI